MPAKTSQDAGDRAEDGPPTGTAGATSAAGAAGAPAEVVGPLVRGIGVLRQLTEAGGSLSPSALERATGLARSTVDRITATLARMGHVRIDGRDVVLTPRVMELGNAYLAALRLPALLGAHADALADELDESVSLAVADLDGVRFIHQATRRRAMSVSFRIGDLLPAERTAPGALFATAWTEADWERWRTRRRRDPTDGSFPAVPPRTALAPEPTAEATPVPQPAPPLTPDPRPELTPPTPELAPTTPELAPPTSESAPEPRPTADDSAKPTADDFAGRVADEFAGRVADDFAERVAYDFTERVADDFAERVAYDFTERVADDFAERVAEARRVGWALDDQLIEPGLIAVSVPVREPGTGRIACVASVVSHTSRHSTADLRSTLLPRLRTAVAAMEAELRTAPPPGPGPALSGLAAWTGASKQELGRGFVESLARGLTVLTAFGEGRPALPLTEVARATGLSRATARRALITYEHLGLVAAHPDRTFTLTPRVLDLGFPPLSRSTLPRLAEPRLRALTDRLHEATALAVLTADGTQIQYTAGAGASRVLTVHITVGTRLPAEETSLGRVLLADTAEPPPPALAGIRERGYALVDEELESGLRSIAVPVRDREGRTVAAVNVATHAARRTVEDCVRDLLPELRATADRIQDDLRTASAFTPVPLL
ncbi:IclR family transcriptional regulator C-terminal domain-containing protein [Streptomyces sp. NPDC096012]|uniref:IclR family transcriptional regulator domain-containing protein n=1 Tax=Streptomyces sp. NPDC096012 TaxID=3155684 RepID=UPI00336A01EC